MLAVWIRTLICKSPGLILQTMVANPPQADAPTTERSTLIVMPATLVSNYLGFCYIVTEFWFRFPNGRQRLQGMLALCFLESWSLSSRKKLAWLELQTATLFWRVIGSWATAVSSRREKTWESWRKNRSTIRKLLRNGSKIAERTGDFCIESLGIE